MMENKIRFIWYGPDSLEKPRWVKDGFTSEGFFWHLLAQDAKVFTVAYSVVGSGWSSPLLSATPLFRLPPDPICCLENLSDKVHTCLKTFYCEKNPHIYLAHVVEIFRNAEVNLVYSQDRVEELLKAQLELHPPKSWELISPTLTETSTHGYQEMPF